MAAHRAAFFDGHHLWKTGARFAPPVAPPAARPQSCTPNMVGGKMMRTICHGSADNRNAGARDNLALFFWTRPGSRNSKA